MVGGSRPVTSGKGATVRAWDDLEETVREWEAKLEAENLGVLGVGPDGGKGRKDILSLSAAMEARVTGSIWDLSARLDAIAEAAHLLSLSAKDRAVCRLLSRAVPWHKIAARVHCSKRRVARVSKLTEAYWRGQIDEKVEDARR